MARLLSSSLGRFSLLVCLLWLTPGTAHASQINFLQVGHGSQVSVAGVRSGTFMAGELNWQFIGAAPEGFASDFYSYCVDVTHNVADPQTVTARSSEGFANGAADGGGRAAWLVNTYAETIRNNTNHAAANIQAAALQVAIWEAMYDDDNDLGAGSFVLNTSGAIETQAQSYLSSLFSGVGGSYLTSVATILDVASFQAGQDQIVSRVSEPSTLLMMGVAFLVFARRTRRTK